ncbi:MAG TPA: hypothetical protein VHX68_02440, partial [Planctomycetaceae bacterium]|nr:hypothetical protein [Planctomycetaceae bacterium]
MAERISLAEIVNKLHSGDESAVYFDRSTGRLVALEPTAVAPDGFERLPSFTERDELEFARQFSETVENAENRQRLRLALSTTGAREPFEAALFRSRIANEWFQFRDERLVQRAK